MQATSSESPWSAPATGDRTWSATSAAAPTGTWSRSATSTPRGRAAGRRRPRAASTSTDVAGRGAGARRHRRRRHRHPGAHPPADRAGGARGGQARAGREAAGRQRGERPRRWSSGRESAGLVLMADHTYCYTPGGAEDPRADRATGALGEILFVDSRPHQPRAGPARRRRLLGPRAARPVDPGLRPARRAGRRRRCPRTAPTRSAPGKACVGYLTHAAAPAAPWRTCTSTGCSPTKIRQMVIGGSRAHPGLGRPQPAAAAERLRPRRRPRAPVDGRRPTARPPTVSYRLGDTWAPALPEREALGAMVDRVRRRDPRGARAADRRRRRAAGAVRARGGQPPASRAGRRRVAGHRAPARAGDRRDDARLQGANVLVTGGAGTIGSTIVDQLLDAGVGAGRRPRQPRPRPAGQPRRRARAAAGSSSSRATSATATSSTT